MKKEEAETKWCPFARVGGQNTGTYESGSGGNRYHNGDGDVGFKLAACITDRCMAWDDEAVRTYDKKGNCTVSGHCKLIGS